MKRKSFLRLRERYARRGKRFVYLDESGFASTACRKHGYAPKGVKIYAEISAHTRPRTSLLAARRDKPGFITPWLFEDTCDGDVFNQWLKTALSPQLTANDVVIMDNATFHKLDDTKRIIESTGATLLYLPPYSPDLNPIEQDFAAIKKIRQFKNGASLDEIVKTYQ